MPRRTIAILAAASTLAAACSDGVCAGVGRPAFEVTVLDARPGGPERIATRIEMSGRVLA